MTLTALLDSLDAIGAGVTARNGHLVLLRPSVVPSDLKEELRWRKTEILAFLTVPETQAHLAEAAAFGSSRGGDTDSGLSVKPNGSNPARPLSPGLGPVEVKAEPKLVEALAEALAKRPAQSIIDRELAMTYCRAEAKRRLCRIDPVTRDVLLTFKMAQ